LNIGGDDDLRLRREALQICLQLPADRREALRVLRYAEDLISGFLAGEEDGGLPRPPSGPNLRVI
jgi:hypothetical protein